jgi:hypothetical protein
VLLLGDFFNSKSELRVVYIPDCRQLLTDPLESMQLSLLLAFADNEDQCQRINHAKTGDDLIDFVTNHPSGTLLFVVDQYNALTVVGGQQDSMIQEKRVARTLIERCALHHFILRAISIDDDNKLDVERKQMNRLAVPLFGELSNVRTSSTS